MNDLATVVSRSPSDFRLISGQWCLKIVSFLLAFSLQVVFDNYYFGDESNLEEAVHLFFKENNTQPPSDLAIAFSQKPDKARV